MNAKQKVINAIEYFENQQDHVSKLESNLEDQRRIVAEYESNLIRTLKAVYGERAKSGVVFRGRRYSVPPEIGGFPESLSVVNADFEVLG